MSSPMVSEWIDEGRAVSRRCCSAVVFFDLYGADGSASGIDVGGVVQPFVGGEQACELLESLAFEALAQFGVDGHFGELVSSQYALDVESRASAEYWLSRT